MPFTTKFAAQFQQLLLTRVQVVLERDVNDALAIIDATLDTVKDFDTPMEIVLNFPAIYLEPDLSKVEQSDDDSYLMAQHSLLVTLAITAPEPDITKARIVKYVRAIDQVLRTMSVADLIGSAPTSSIRKPTWEVTEHRYGALRQSETIYRREAQLVLVVQILER